MKLYLVQHAAARSEEEDSQRPLSDRGWVDIRKVAAFVASQCEIKPKRISHSGKTRAEQTAAVLAERLKPIDGVQAEEGLGPKDDPAIWVKKLGEINDELMLVGHLPHLSKLAALLLSEQREKQIIKFQMAGIVCLEKDESELWSVQWMIIPQLLE